MALKLVPAPVHPASQPRKLLFVFPGVMGYVFGLAVGRSCWP